MVESGLLAGQLSASALQQSPQSLPVTETRDSERFQDLIAGDKNSSTSGTSIQPQSLEAVLQFVEPGQVDTQTMVDQMIDQASRIDGTYHSLLDQLGNRASFSDFLGKKDRVESNEMMTYPAVDTGQGTDSNPLETALQSAQDSQQAALDYQGNLNSWATQFRVWTAGVELVSAAAKQVSTAFQTLFRASG